MKGWKEKKSKLVQWISDLTQSQYNICFGLFIVLGVSLLILALDLFSDDSFHIDKDSARYLLSALVQSQAAIVAIVVTLTLVAIQLVVSSYSLRAIDMFKKIPMWWFLTCYGASIFYGLFVLGLIREDVPLSEFISSYPISLESCIYFAYWFGFVTFALLIVYMGKIFIFLEPSNIIERLSDRITKENVVKFIESIEKQKDGQTQLTKDDPVQPIMDIIHSSVMKYDIATTRYGLRTVTKKAVDAIHYCKYLNNEDISMYFCDHLGRVGRYAVSAGDDESAMEIVERLEEIGKSTTEMSYGKATEIVAQHIEIIGTFAAEKRLIFATVATVESLEAVGIFAAKNRLDDAVLQAIDSLGNVGMHASENKLKIATQFAAKFLGNVGKCAAEHELKDATKQAADSIGLVGKYAVENELKDAIEQAVDSLSLVGTTAAEKGDEFEDAVVRVVECLNLIGKSAMRRELEEAVWQTLESLRRVGKTAVENGLRRAAADVAMDIVFFGEYAIKKRYKGTTEQLIVGFLGQIGTSGTEKGKQFEPVTWQSAESLGLLGMAAAEKGKEFENVTNEVLWHLNSIGRSAEGQGFEKATKQVAQSFIDIGVFAVKNGLAGTAQEAAKFLAKLSMPNKEPVEQAIRESESKLQEYFELFQKFINLYEQQLEELRTQNPD